MLPMTIAFLVLLKLNGSALPAADSHAQNADQVAVRQDATSRCGGAHQPGDKIVCLVTFARAADFTTVYITFNLQTDKRPSEISRVINVSLDNSRRIDEKTYEVSGVLPSNLASGTYSLSAITAVLSSNGFRIYENGFGFTSDITMEFQNPLPPPAKERQGPPTILLGPTTEFVLVEAPPDVPPAVKQISGIPPGEESSFHQTSGYCGGQHSWGDEIKCYVTFDGETDFKELNLDFALRTDRPNGELGLVPDFSFNQTKRIDSHTYEVSGIVTACLSGRYSISWMVAERAGHQTLFYDGKRGPEITSDVAIEILRPNPNPFPDIERIRSEAGSAAK